MTNLLFPVVWKNERYNDGKLFNDGKAYLQSTLESLEEYFNADDYTIENGYHLGNYATSIGYVGLDTFSDQDDDYLRIQMSGGGPSDEFRIYESGRIEYIYLHWGTGIGFDVTDSETVQQYIDYCFCGDIDGELKRYRLKNGYQEILDLRNYNEERKTALEDDIESKIKELNGFISSLQKSIFDAKFSDAFIVVNEDTEIDEIDDMYECIDNVKDIMDDLLCDIETAKNELEEMRNELDGLNE